jgi:hypothetical protein
LYGIAIFDEEQGLIYKITGLSLSSFEKMGLIAIILKIKGLLARALGFMIHFSIENPMGFITCGPRDNSIHGGPLPSRGGTLAGAQACQTPFF